MASGYQVRRLRRLVSARPRADCGSERAGGREELGKELLRMGDGSEMSGVFDERKPGLRPAVRECAGRLRAEGHTVHTPDSFDGVLTNSSRSGLVDDLIVCPIAPLSWGPVSVVGVDRRPTARPGHN